MKTRFRIIKFFKFLIRNINVNKIQCGHSEISSLIPERELIDLSSTCHHTLQKLYVRTVSLQNFQCLKLPSFLHIATSEKQYHISKGELHKKSSYLQRPSLMPFLQITASRERKKNVSIVVQETTFCISFYLSPFNIFTFLLLFHRPPPPSLIDYVPLYYCNPGFLNTSDILSRIILCCRRLSCILQDVQQCSWLLLTEC